MKRTAETKRRADLAAAVLAAAALFGAMTASLSALGPGPSAPAGFVCDSADGCGAARIATVAGLVGCRGLDRMLLGGRLDLNRASVSELDLAPGIGPATARAIVAARDRSGPFRSTDDAVRAAGLRRAGARALYTWADAGDGR